MSFSQDVKSELCRVPCPQTCCMACETAAALLVGAHPAGEGRVAISTENAAFASRLFRHVKSLADRHPDVGHARERNLRKHMLYHIILPEETARILAENRATEETCCRKAYLRGVFLTGGSMIHPEKGYHLELTCPSVRTAGKIAARLKAFHLNGGIAERNGSYFVYLKEAENIVDFLNLVGAHQALLTFENVRILKGMRNQVNRIVNCETANLDRTASASRRQRACIEALAAAGRLTKLPPALREIAELRLENPEMSLEDLGKMATPAIGKSGVNHRLRTIVRIAGRMETAP